MLAIMDTVHTKALFSTFGIEGRGHSIISNEILTPRLPASLPKKVRFEPGSDRFSPIAHSLNLDPDLGFGSAISLNSDPNLGPVLVGSGSNRGSEPNIGITTSDLQLRQLFPDDLVRTQRAPGPIKSLEA